MRPWFARFRNFADARACALHRGRQGDLYVDIVSSFIPNLLILEDSFQRLCLAGRIGPDGFAWCISVASDAEARQVVLDASRLRAQAMAALDRDASDAARILRFRAMALEARLVDSVWRTAAHAGRLQAV